jgi:hypothetical protein
MKSTTNFENHHRFAYLSFFPILPRTTHLSLSPSEAIPTIFNSALQRCIVDSERIQRGGGARQGAELPEGVQLQPRLLAGTRFQLMVAPPKRILR